MTAAAPRRHRYTATDPRIGMTPMIDVVFLLLIFFVVTVRRHDIESRLSATRPSARPDIAAGPLPVRIDVMPDGYALNGRRATLGDLDRYLGRLAAIHREVPLVLASANDATHGQAVAVMDLCAKTGMRNIALLTAQARRSGP